MPVPSIAQVRCASRAATRASSREDRRSSTLCSYWVTAAMAWVPASKNALPSTLPGLSSARWVSCAKDLGCLQRGVARGIALCVPGGERHGKGLRAAPGIQFAHHQAQAPDGVGPGRCLEEPRAPPRATCNGHCRSDVPARDGVASAASEGASAQAHRPLRRSGTTGLGAGAGWLSRPAPRPRIRPSASVHGPVRVTAMSMRKKLAGSGSNNN